MGIPHDGDISNCNDTSIMAIAVINTIHIIMTGNILGINYLDSRLVWYSALPHCEIDFHVAGSERDIQNQSAKSTEYIAYAYPKHMSLIIKILSPKRFIFINRTNYM